MRYLIERFLINGVSFSKNNIFDAIIMSCLNEEEDILITFEEGVIKHMEKYRLSRKSYRNSLEMIKNLKGI